MLPAAGASIEQRRRGGSPAAAAAAAPTTSDGAAHAARHGAARDAEQRDAPDPEGFDSGLFCVTRRQRGEST
jgi:hypothetical protein